jgi:hypothetical protein
LLQLLKAGLEDLVIGTLDHLDLTLQLEDTALEMAVFRSKLVVLCLQDGEFVIEGVDLSEVLLLDLVQSGHYGRLCWGGKVLELQK